MQAFNSQQTNKVKRVFAGRATAAHGGLLSGVWGRERKRGEERGTGPPALNAHAQLLPPSHRPKFNGSISGPSRRGMGTRGPICAAWQLNPPVQLRKR